ncbi:MAG: N-acetylneuraminate synthase [Candidatus Rokubacteria bacterium]|nr:N-acetylneuraminate synthase [Candidatus Rokubacteria bacterium]
MPPDPRTFVIAEAGVNHNGDLALARKMVDVAADAGADAVKFQTFSVDRLVTRTAAPAEYQQRTGAASQYDMLRRLELSPAAHEELLAHCGERGIEFMSAAFDPESARFLAGLGVRRLKVPSGELTNLPLLEVIGRLGCQIIVSTGMAHMAEVETAVATLYRAGASDLVILQCVSNYPADPAATNLRVMDSYARVFGVPVGLSDHTVGLTIAIAAVARGASYLEKHFTLDRSLPGPDHQASLEPAELAALVRAVRDVEVALGDGVKQPTPSELPVRAVARKSLVTVRDLAPGSVLRESDLAILRPGTGLPPGRLAEVLGRRTARAIPAETPITDDMLEPAGESG